MVRTRQSAPTCQGCDRGNDYHAARIGSVTDPVSTEPISCSHLRTRCLAADRSLATPATHIKVRVQSAERKSALGGTRDYAERVGWGAGLPCTGGPRWPYVL